MLPLARMAAGEGPGAKAEVSGDPRLRPAAHEFEACLMKEFLEPLQRDGLFDPEKDSGGSSDNALMSYGSEALARAISDRGGFGIATKIIGQLEGRASAGNGNAQSEKFPGRDEKSDSSAQVLRR